MSSAIDTHEGQEGVDEFLEKLTEKEFAILFDVISKIMISFGDFIRSFGTIERDYGEYLVILQQAADYGPVLLERFVEEAPPEILQDFMRLFIKLFVVLPKLSKMMELEPDEKIKLSEDLYELAEAFTEMRDIARAREGEEK